MTGFIFNRLLQAIPTLIGISLVIFLLMRIAPGDPSAMILDPMASEAAREAFKAEHGLDRPLLDQYVRFFANALQGNWGQSYRSGSTVTSEILAALPGTIELTLFAFVVAIVVGIGLGVLAALHRNSLADYASVGLAVIGVSMPVFWLGLLLIMLFSVELRWLPVSGRMNPRLLFESPTGFMFFDALRQGDFRAFRDAFVHLLLPGLTLGLSGSALIARMTRTTLLEVLNEDYVRTALGKGLSKSQVVWRHALRTALIPIVTVVGTQAGSMLSGAVLTETVFSWPGIGTLMVNSVFIRDLPVVQGVVLVMGVIFVLVNLATDVVYSVIDPRIRYG